MSSIGLIGAHRTGKTTLAQKYAEANDIEFVQTSTSQVIKELGYDIHEAMSLNDRVFVQDQILDNAIEKYKAAKGPFITDRTPLDMAAYTIAELTQSRASALLDDPLLDDLICQYVDRCYKVTNLYFSSLFVIQPGIPLVNDTEGKVTAPLSKSYVELINTVIRGLVADERMVIGTCIFPKVLTDLNERMEAISDVVGVTNDYWEKGIQHGAVNFH